MPPPIQSILKYELQSGERDTEKCCSEEGWQIRQFVEADFEDVYKLCCAAFPLEYPTDWYREVVTGRYINFGLYHHDILTSLLIAEYKTVGECDLEDRTLCKDDTANVVYILSLAVNDQYRRMGLATLLLKHLLSTMCNLQPIPRLIYLHVLSDNLPAIFFYHKNGFRHHATLPNYYMIANKYHDGFTFVRHLSPGPFGELLSTLFQACTSLLEFFGRPFRRCINERNNPRNVRQSPAENQSGQLISI